MRGHSAGKSPGVSRCARVSVTCPAGAGAGPVNTKCQKILTETSECTAASGKSVDRTDCSGIALP